jgi:hypothetical protein
MLRVGGIVVGGDQRGDHVSRVRRSWRRSSTELSEHDWEILTSVIRQLLHPYRAGIAITSGTATQQFRRRANAEKMTVFGSRRAITDVLGRGAWREA